MFNAAHNVLQLQGTVESVSDEDVWTCTLRLGEGNYLVDGTGIDYETVVANINTDLNNDLTKWWNGIAGYLSASVKFTGFKFNAVDVNGHYINQERTNFYDFATPKPGIASTMAPAQCSVAVTFRTAAARGLAATGRIYLPPTSTGAIGAGGRLSTQARDAFATNTATLLTDLSNWPLLDVAQDPGRVVIASKVGAGAMRRVNRVDVGDLYDTQRRRRNRLTEIRSTAQVVTS